MKNKKRGMALGIATLLILSATPLFVDAEPQETINVIIGFHGKPDIGLIEAYNGEVKNTIDPIYAVVATIPKTAMVALQHNPKVRYVEEDRYIQFIQDQQMPWGIGRIDADKVWSSNNGSGAVIAICDTGIDYDHPDLASNYVAWGYDHVNGDTDPMDDHGHGTHCAGIAAAVNNDIGVVGVAPGASLMAEKVLDSSGGGYPSWISSGITHAANNSADIISLSLGSDSSSSVIKAACNYAYNKGCLIVAAAGNDGNPPGKGDNVDYPARYNTVIAVAATDQDDERAKWRGGIGSSTGPDVELAAPGDKIYSTLWNDTYETKSGTSMACPHVAGTAALVLASTVDPAYDFDEDGVWDNDEVRQKMDDTAQDLGDAGRDNLYGYGLVDAEAATSPPPKVHDVAITAIDAPSSVIKGETATINVTVANQGTFTENTTVNLTEMYDGDPIGSEVVTLDPGKSTVVTFYWNTTNEALGDHILEAEASVVPGETETADNSMTTTVNVYEQGQPGDMYVWDISWSSKTAGPNKFLYHTVTVMSDSGPVSGATVYSTLTHNNTGNNWTFSRTTDTNGQVKFTLGKAPLGNYTALVTDITHATYTHNPAMDVDNPDYYTLT